MYISRLKADLDLVKKTKRAVYFNVLYGAGKVVTVDENGKDDGVYKFIAKGIAVKLRIRTFFFKIRRYCNPWRSNAQK